MSDVFISYARSSEREAKKIAEALRARGYGVWRDDELPAHRAYADVIEERLRAAKAVVVLWSAEAVKSQWVRAEAEVARGAGSLVQLTLDGATPPLPFNQIQCADLAGWRGENEHAGWRKVLGSLAELASGAAAVASGPPSAHCPQVRYARSGDFDIAYMTLGEGPLDIIITPGMWSHLEAGWEVGAIREGLVALSAFSRVITFDKRGQGMSDRMVGSPTLEERMDDIRAVMDAAGSERAVLWGASEGGPMSLLFAATHPDRVQGLILAGSFARLDADGDTSVSQRFDAMPNAWGAGLSKDLVFPDFAEAVLSRSTCAHLERMSSTPSNVARQIELLKAIDVRAALPAIRAPTLVIHRSEDPLIPLARGRELAAGIPGARLAIGPGCSHAHFDEEGVMLAAVGEFFATLTAPEAAEERLATVLVCRGAMNTGLAGAAAERFRGKALVAPDGETVYVFDGPTRAVECALANVAAAPSIRQGIALGIVRLAEDRVSGPAATQASETAVAAASGKVLVTRTLRDVLAGARFRLEATASGGALYQVAF